MDTVHVLVFGSIDDGPCDTYRFGMHRDALAAQGVELRAWTDYRLGVPAGLDDSVDAAFASEGAVLDRSELDWADVLVFRRFYVTRWSCRDCALVGDRQADLERRGRGTGHRISEPGRLFRPLFSALDAYPELLRGRAVVYDTDDDLLRVPASNGVARRVATETAMVERMLRRADLVTVATPVLADRFRPFNNAIRVVRNAVQPDWYTPAPGAPPVQGDPRLLYYAKPNRMRDYAVCRPAVDAVAASHPGARRVWLGALDAPAGGSPEPVIAIMDEVGPFVEGAAAFARSLAMARPDIGLAPLVGDVYDQAKSELHWLEYSLAGAATVATRMPGGGPFDALRDGVDGLLASTQEEWHAALDALASSPGRREELAGRARERVLAEYTVDVRAPEWAAAYRWAAEHAGRAVEGRVHGLGALRGAEVAREAAASLAHRRLARRRAVEAPAVLARLRDGGTTCWRAAGGVQPLVSVVIPVTDEPDALVSRAIRSACAGTYPAIEVLVIGWRPGLAALGAAHDDPRVRGELVEAPALPVAEGPGRWASLGHLVAAAADLARGEWIAPMCPDLEFSADHVEVLLGVALEHELELVYGQVLVRTPGAHALLLGAWPPDADGVLTLGSEVLARGLLAVAPVDAESWREARSPGWALWSDLLAAGVRAAGIEHPVAELAPMESAA